MTPTSPPRHFPYVTRSVMSLFDAGKLPTVQSIDVEPSWGQYVKIRYVNGSRRITYGNDLGLNTGSAEEVAKDKGFTKQLLRRIGVKCPDGVELIMPWWAREMTRQAPHSSDQITLSDVNARACEYILDRLSFPVYVKPVNGSKGHGVYRVSSCLEVAVALAEYEAERVKVVVIEEAVHYPDYRVVVLDGLLISAYERVPLAVTGDGVRSILQLLQAKQEEFIMQGRDSRLDKVTGRVEKELRARDMSLDSVPSSGSQITLLPVSNLSQGGSSVDVTDRIHPKWVELAQLIASEMGLRLAGIDIACEDITLPSSNYSILEVNASPGLNHYAMSGPAQEELVQQLYAAVLSTSTLLQGEPCHE